MEIDDFLRDLGYREAETSGGTEFVRGLRESVDGRPLRPRSRKSLPDLVECEYKYDLHREIVSPEITSCGVHLFEM